MIIEKWKNANTFVIGKYHISNNTVCQDRTLYLEGNGVKVLALSDGAGSQKESHIGAEIVCNSICELMMANFNEYLLLFEYEKIHPKKHAKNMNELSKEIVLSIQERLKLKALELNIPLKSLGCTMLFFAIKNGFYIMGHIGDGVIAGLYNENNRANIKIISEPENGQASNITFFVSDSDAVDHLRLKAGKIENLTGVIMTSDGAGDVLFNSNGVDKSTYEIFSKFYGKTSAEYETIISEYLSKIIANYSTDDLSINLLVLEDIVNVGISKDYIEYLFDDITSSKQIIRKSQYCYYLDPSISGESEFNNSDDVRRYLKWD